jgi:hypothetical protein
MPAIAEFRGKTFLQLSGQPEPTASGIVTNIRKSSDQYRYFERNGNGLFWR